MFLSVEINTESEVRSPEDTEFGYIEIYCQSTNNTLTENLKGGTIDRKLIEKFINKTILTSLTMEIEITKITSKGQVVIPQNVREKIRVQEGERFFVYSSDDDSIVLKRTRNLEATDDFKEFDNVFKSMWRTAKAKKITRKDIAEEIKAVRSSKKNA
jgi:antitoxin PrlF